MIQHPCCYRTEDNSPCIRDQCQNTPTQAFAIKGCTRNPSPTDKGIDASVISRLGRVECAGQYHSALLACPLHPASSTERSSVSGILLCRRRSLLLLTQ